VTNSLPHFDTEFIMAMKARMNVTISHFCSSLIAVILSNYCKMHPLALPANIRLGLMWLAVTNFTLLITIIRAWVFGYTSHFSFSLSVGKATRQSRVDYCPR